MQPVIGHQTQRSDSRSDTRSDDLRTDLRSDIWRSEELSYLLQHQGRNVGQSRWSAQPERGGFLLRRETTYQGAVRLAAGRGVGNGARKFEQSRRNLRPALIPKLVWSRCAKAATWQKWR
jgi:hypothetical protein